MHIFTAWRKPDSQGKEPQRLDLVLRGDGPGDRPVLGGASQLLPPVAMTASCMSVCWTLLPTLLRSSAVMETLGETVGNLRFSSLPWIKDAPVFRGKSKESDHRKAGGAALPNWF